VDLDPPAIDESEQDSRQLVDRSGLVDFIEIAPDTRQKVDLIGIDHDHLGAARAHLTGLPDIDLSPTLKFLEHNELGLAFDCLVDLGDDLDLPLTFWNHLDQAAREMRLYTDALHKPHLTAADLCRRHVAAASEKE
jgi:hypothetical protein